MGPPTATRRRQTAIGSDLRCLIPKPLLFWHPGHPQALIDALASCEIHGIVAWVVSAIAPDSETRIERKARLRRSPCLIQLTDERQGGRKIEMRIGEISVGLKAPAQPNNRFGVGAVPKFGETDNQSPDIDVGIAGREAERLLYMGFG